MDAGFDAGRGSGASERRGRSGPPATTDLGADAGGRDAGTDRGDDDLDAGQVAFDAGGCDGEPLGSRERGGGCIDDAPFPLGGGAVVGGRSAPLADGMIIATPVYVPETVMLRRLAIRTAGPDSDGGQAKLAIYDTIIAGGYPRPGNRLTSGLAPIDLPEGEGLEQVNPINANLVLTADTLYWVVAKVTHLLGDGVRLYEIDSDTPSRWNDWPGGYFAVGHGFGGGFPDSFPDAPIVVGKQLSLFVEVERVLEGGRCCAWPEYVCRMQATCEPNSVTHLGLHERTTGTRNMSGFRFYATPVRTDHAVVLSELGILAVGGFGGVRLGVYSDTLEDGYHWPDALVVDAALPLQVPSEKEAVATPRRFTQLEANTRYWVVAVTSASAAAVYRSQAEPGTDVLYVDHPADFSYGDYSLPERFPRDEPSLGVEFSQRYSIFMRVRDAVVP
jgi:hypothetical protein